MLRGCSLLIGMHPDEATEAIVDAGLKYGKPFAVLPCCVFPQLFPERRIQRAAAGERAVVRYSEFIEYLRAKSDDIELAHLPFEGRNQVVFRRKAAPCRPQLQLAWGGEEKARNRRLADHGGKATDESQEEVKQT